MIKANKLLKFVPATEGVASTGRTEVVRRLAKR